MRVGFAVGNQTLQIGFQLGEFPLEITGDPHEIASVFDAFDRQIDQPRLCFAATVRLFALGDGCRTPLYRDAIFPSPPRGLDPRADELALLGEIGQAMRDASICGLGQTASSAIESALRQPGLVAL